MSNLNTDLQQSSVQEEETSYNDEPVVYCAHCLSLAIRDLDGSAYCDKCGSTDVEYAHIYDWEELYVQRYGTRYLLDKINK
mgnify:FL=1|jgi:hypothetical protein